MNLRGLSRRSVLLLAILAGAGRVAAQPKPCADDVKRLCPDVTPGKGAVLNCLKPHAKELSPECQKTLDRIERRRRALDGRQRQVRTARAEITPTPRGPKE